MTMTDTPLFEVESAGTGCQVPDHLRPKPSGGQLLFELAIRGTPAPQGSKKPFPIYKGRGENKVFTGKTALVEDAKGLKPWRDRVTDKAIEAYGNAPPLDEPLAVAMVFTAVRPRSHYRTGRNASLLRDSAPAQPASKPDLSKLARAVEDSFNDARVWRDDALVVEYLRLAKVYANEDVDALERPGVLIRIYRIGAAA